MSDWSNLNWERLSSYLSGELSAQECADIERWIAERNEHRAVAAQLRAVWRVVRPVRLEPLDVVELQQRVWQRVGVERSAHLIGVGQHVGKRALGTQPLRRRIKENLIPSQWAWPTLVVLLMGVVGTVTAWNAGIRYLSHREATSTSTYTTGNGQRANITLPDGNTVALNVASRLDVPADYLAGHHTVHLVGEALFTVIHREGTPFTVTAGSATARVLGTSFAVRHYPADTTATVAVRDGKVAVRSTVLTAARQAMIDRAGVAQVGPADPSQFSFATGVLTFSGTPLREAIAMLDRWFDADIRLEDTALGTRQVTGGFPAGSLADLTESLELTFNVHVVRDGRILTVYPR